MTKTGHTPGPWAVNRHSKFTVESNGRSVATTGGYSDNTRVSEVHEENVANAKLISSAPEMLDALEIALRTLKALIGSEAYEWVEVQEINRVIQKARTLR